MEYIFYIGLGMVAGFISGLFGMGGGVIIVPALIFTFHAQGIPTTIATHMAIATSLASIVVTSLSSVVAHSQHSAIHWSVVRWITPGIIIGTVSGSLLVISLPGVWLQFAFGVFLVLVAAKMLFYTPVVEARPQRQRTKLLLAGGGIGAISALLGIGGGSLTVPLLTRTGIQIRQAISTAAAIGFPIAVVAAIIYSHVEVLDQHVRSKTLGYIYLPAWFGIITASIPGAKMGAFLAYRLNERVLAKNFALLLLMIGVRFIWINATNYFQ